MAPYAPYYPYSTDQSPWHPSQYQPKSIVKTMSSFPRYGHTDDINSILSGDNGDDGSYVYGIVISSCCLLVIFVLWSILLIFLKLYSGSWASGYMERPEVPVASPRKFQSGEQHQHHHRRRGGRRSSSGSSGSDHHNSSSREQDELHNNDDTSSTSSASSHGSHNSSSDGNSSNSSLLSIGSSIFWSDAAPSQEEMTMPVIARAQQRDDALRKAQKQRPQDYSTTTNGQLTLITTLDHHSRESFPQFRVYIPHSLRLTLLRTYHDCLVFPDDVANAHTMIYEFFTWREIRKDVSRYVKKYRQCMERGDNAAIIPYGDDDADDDSLAEGTPITLDVIAREQRADSELTRMARKTPSVFSTATNGNIQLITARGKDKKYRIVIPKSLQPKVLVTYHDCLVSPTAENNFEKVLYVHFTWNGIHKDVENYVRNDGLTREMKSRRVHASSDASTVSSRGSEKHHFNVRDVFLSGQEDEEDCAEPIGLDEIAKEQKKDKELRQLKKEEPFVFSTVRYGNTLLTTAQNFRDNKYRIVIPKRLQGRMLKTYRQCLLNPTPDRNFDTLLYNHFTWNGIHDDVDSFVKNGGHISEEEDDLEGSDECKPLNPLSRKRKKKKRSTGETTATSGDSMDDTDNLEWIRQNHKFERKVRMIRIAFLLSGLFTIISSILFFEEGVVRVFDALTDAQRGLQHAEDTANAAIFLIDDFLGIQSDIQNTAKEVGTYNNSQGCFPVLPLDSSSNNTAAMPISSFDIGINLRDTAVRVELEMRAIESDLEQLTESAQKIEATLEDFKTYVNAAKVLVIFIDIIVVSLMASCLLAWMGEQHFITKCLRTTIIIPLFATLTILFWIFSSVVLLATMAGADFCSMPDESSTALIISFQEQLSPIIFSLAMYYVTGCLQERLPATLESLSSVVISGGEILHTLVDAAEAGSQQTGQCGGVVTLLEVTDTAYHGIYDSLMGVRGILECPNFNPIYTIFVYDALCNSGVAGLSWLFFTSLSMAIFSMVMITLRAAIRQY